MKDGSKFCQKCGTAVDGDSSAPSPEQPVANSAPDKAPATSDKNYYEILEITRTASIDEIQAAIKKQRTLWSSRVPRGGSMGERARQTVEKIGLAEATLLDPKKRVEYDESLKGEKDYQVIVPAGEKNWLEVLYSYYDQQDWDMAVEAAERATRQQGDNPEAWFLAATIYMNMDDYDKANKAAQQVLLLEPDNPTAYGIRGDVLLIKKGNANKAIEMYNKMKALAKDSATRKLAEESIVVANATAIANRLDSIVKSIPNEFEYSKAIMDLLNNSLQKVDDIKNQMERTFAQISDPSSWLQSVKAADIDDCNTVASEIQKLIDEGNEKVHLPGFWLTIVCWAVFVLICFGVMSLDAGGGFVLLLAISAGCYVRAFVIQTKPRWKVGSAWLYKYMR
jgi:tetratricopeptide (TPR) repeat protein